MDTVSSIDSVKKGRLFFIAVISTIVILITQLTDTVEIPFWLISIRAFIYSFVIYISLLWGLRFQVTLYSLVFVLPLTAIYLFTQYVFFEVFFLTITGRVIEILFMLSLGIVVFVSNYAAILMANIFNVYTIKDIPLIHAARTTSYILLLLIAYFVTYSLLHSGLNLLAVTILFSIIMFISIYLKLKNSDLQEAILFKYSFGITLLSLFSLFSIVFVDIDHAIGGLVPTSIVYAMVGTILNNNKQLLQKKDIFIYISSIIIVYLLVIFFGR